MTAARRSPEQSLVVQELSAVLGLSVVERLLGDFGGVSLFIPKTRLGENHPLVVSIGAPAAYLVQEYWGGTTIDFPVCSNKRARILELREAGTLVRHIARQVGLTERRVYQVLAEEEDTSAQASLFT